MRRLAVSLIITILVALSAWVIWTRLINLADTTPEPPTNTEPLPAVVQPPDSITTAPYQGYLAPDFSLRSYVGSQVRLSDSLNKPIILTFWQGQCLFCLSQLQTLTTLARNNPELTVLAVNRGDDIMDTQHVYGVLEPPLNFILLLDPNDIQFGRYQGQAMPTTFFIDRRGVIIERLAQEIRAQEAEELLEEIE